MDRHPHGREWRAELMRGREEEVISQLVEALEPCHVLKQHRGRDNGAVLIMYRLRAR